jgi:hypothetical protein
MSSGFLNDTATLAVFSLWELYNGTPTASPLTIETPPTGSFRCKVTLSSVAGHTDCTGTVTVGSEILTFTAAGTKTTTVTLTAKPVVVYANIDCHIHITAIDTSGADILKETDTTIAVDWDTSTTYYENAQGTFTRSDSNCATDNMTAKVGDSIIHSGKTYSIKNIKDGEKTLGGTTLTRILQL